jgi:hypothetical protein
MSKGKQAAAERLFETEERPMTDDDRKTVGDELAEIEQQIRAVEDEKRSVNAVYGGRLKKLKTRVDSLSRQWIDGIIEVQFEVVEEHDDGRFMVQVVRKDNGRPVGGMRPMTEPEKEAARKRLQLPIPGTEDGIVDDSYHPPRDTVTTPSTPRAKTRKGGKR